MELGFAHRKSLFLGLLVLMLLTFTACGVKGPVKPPRARVPEAPQNPALRQIGSCFLISWTIPKTNEDGSPLQDLQGFDVYKTRFETGSACPGCHESEKIFRQIDLEYLRQASRREDVVFFRDSSLEPEFGYRYKIVPFNSSGQTGSSAILEREFLIAPPPPKELRIDPGAKAVTLTWSGTATETSGTGFLGYNIYRRRKEASITLTPINEDYWIATSYTDRALPNADILIYTVRSVWRLKGLVVESADSEPVSATLPEND